MKRLIRPLVYILGFSVFAACTTTKFTPIAEVPPSNEARDVDITLTNGFRLTVRSATISPEDIRGVITAEDSAQVGRYFQDWQTELMKGLLIEHGSSKRIYHVAIPRSGVIEVQTTEVARSRTTAIVLFAVLGVVLIPALVALQNWGP